MDKSEIWTVCGVILFIVGLLEAFFAWIWLMAHGFGLSATFLALLLLILVTIVVFSYLRNRNFWG